MGSLSFSVLSGKMPYKAFATGVCGLCNTGRLSLTKEDRNIIEKTLNMANWTG